MAGVKGMRGGGGYRPGSGRKRKPASSADNFGSPITRDPLEFLLDVMQGRVDANAGQVRAAVAAAQYVHMKKGDGGVKDAKKDAARKAASGKFAPSSPPKLH